MPITQEPPITEDFQTRGNSVYGCSKAVAEKYIQECNPHIILRYAHIIGFEKRHHGLVGNFISRINKGMKPTLYNGVQSNDFVSVKDIAMANYLALTASWDSWNTEYNIGTSEELSAGRAGDIVCEVFGYEGEVEIKKGREVDPIRFVYNIDKARKCLGFDPQYSFKDAVLEIKKEMDKNA
jgi:nucleoside-diphosphate-sugar epimerase